MKGKVFKYGARGDPMIKGPAGKIVILTGYDTKPKIGAEVNYAVQREANSVIYATFVRDPAGTLKKVLERTDDLPDTLDDALAPVIAQYRREHPVQQTQVQQTRVNPEGQLEYHLSEIQQLWQKSFVMHMTPESREGFPKSLQEIRDRFKKGDKEGAAKEAHENYQWAAEKSEYCEVLKPGFAYFHMFRAFQALEDFIRASTSEGK
jgi:hypothetical protein